MLTWQSVAVYRVRIPMRQLPFLGKNLLALTVIFQTPYQHHRHDKACMTLRGVTVVYRHCAETQKTNNCILLDTSYAVQGVAFLFWLRSERECLGRIDSIQ